MGYIGVALGLCGCLFTIISFIFAGMGQAYSGAALFPVMPF